MCELQRASKAIILKNYKKEKMQQKVLLEIEEKL